MGERLTHLIDKPMKPLPYTLLLLFLIANSFSGIAQDTVIVGEQFFCSSVEYPNRGKYFTSRVEYGREDIVFNQFHTRVEWCYYYDGKRYAFGADYHIVDDTTIIIGDTAKTNSKITYHKLSDTAYQVTHYYDDIISTGIASSVIPLQKKDSFTIQYTNGDTLWLEDYSKVNWRKSYRHPTYLWHKTALSDSVFIYSELDSYPTTRNDSALDYITISPKYRGYCYDTRRIRGETVEFIVTKEGKAVNINPDYTCIDEKIAFILLLKRMEPLIPAEKNGKPVHTHWIMRMYRWEYRDDGLLFDDYRLAYYEDMMKKKFLWSKKRKNQYDKMYYFRK